VAKIEGILIICGEDWRKSPLEIFWFKADLDNKNYRNRIFVEKAH
jgi:hypothetical protein